MSQGLALSVLGPQEACAHSHQEVNIFHLVGVSTSVKQLRKLASDINTII